jgi:hypothetical protein
MMGILRGNIIVRVYPLADYRCTSDKKTGRATFARACIAAGMLALNNKGDIEFAISMFEKAITWYPENERLLEE